VRPDLDLSMCHSPLSTALEVNRSFRISSATTFATIGGGIAPSASASGPALTQAANASE
jgi:hypothetical protein